MIPARFCSIRHIRPSRISLLERDLPWSIILWFETFLEPLYLTFRVLAKEGLDVYILQ